MVHEWESTSPFAGLVNPRTVSLERFPVRTRDNALTCSSWRLLIETDKGPGAIVLIEYSPETSFYRGEGVFLGWSQERMAAAYKAFVPDPEPDNSEIPQLG
jgi:hypothetical protein